MDNLVDMMDYPEFALDNPCIKCGSVNASTELVSSCVIGGGIFPEHFLRRCIMCKYSWIERTQDCEK